MRTLPALLALALLFIAAPARALADVPPQGGCLNGRCAVARTRGGDAKGAAAFLVVGALASWRLARRRAAAR